MTLLTRLALGAGTAVAGLAGFTAWNTRRAEQLVPPDGRFLDLAGTRIHFVDEGAGSPIVMVHGLGGQLRNLTYGLSGVLARQHRVITLDRPGSGYSTSPTPLGLCEQAAVIVRLIEALGLEKPLLVGHSLGGAIALAVALNHPKAIGGLALLAPLTQPVAEVPPVFRALTITSPTLRAVIGNTLAAPLGRLNADAGNAVVFGPEAAPADFDTRGGGVLTLRPDTFVAACADVAASQAEVPLLAARYGELRLPVGILFGAEDMLLSPQEQGPPTVAAIPGAHYATIEGGHMFPVTQPERTAQWIMEQASRL